MILLIPSTADGLITQSKGLNSDCSREARVESSTKNLLAVKIMLVIGNRINYSVAQFRTGLGLAHELAAEISLKSQQGERVAAVIHRLRESGEEKRA